MAGSGKSFKDTYGVSSTFTGGFLPPDQILIVGHDIPVEDWNEDLWDDARLNYAKANPIDAEKMLVLGGVKDPVAVTKRQGKILAVEGRRRILGAREANGILKVKGADPATWIELPIYVDKSSDLEISVRLGNEGRLDDPPWIKARNAGRLRERGKGEDQILAVFGVDRVTIRNWFCFLDCIPEIQRMAEERNIPFAIAIEIGRMGKGEPKKQAQAIAYLFDTKANLKGEDGKANARAVCKAVLDGTLSTYPVPAPAQEETPVSAVASEPTPPVPVAPIPVPVPGISTQAQGAWGASPPRAGEPASGPQRVGGTRNIVTQKRLTPDKLRSVTAALEPALDGHKDDQEELAYAIMAVVSGRDPSVEGLKKFPSVYTAFKLVVPSQTVTT